MEFMVSAAFWEKLISQLTKTLITEDRYKLFLKGLGNTLLISAGALAVGLIIGFLVAILIYANKRTGKLKVLTKAAKLYVYIIRGTPMVLQLMIMYFIILASVNADLIVAILAFGINSGAYVSEIMRGGLDAVEDGQSEAGRSLGFSSVQTMRYIVAPQAIKHALPALGNEFIALIKETSVAGYVAIVDITFAAKLIQSRTYDAFFPLIIAALMYLILVYLLTFLLKKIERRLAKGDRN